MCNSREMARLWRERWIETEQAGISVEERLSDVERPGSPTKFSMEQVLKLFAIACESPEKYGRPISYWTSRELAEEMVKQRIVVKYLEKAGGKITQRSNPKTSFF